MNRERIQQLGEEYMAEHPGTAGTVEPFIFDAQTEADLEDGEGGFPFPIMTDLLLSNNWEPTEQKWFVDSSGFGRDDEPALTMDDFRQQLLEYIQQHPNHGFALSGVGQFQTYVTAYRRVDRG